MKYGNKNNINPDKNCIFVKNSVNTYALFRQFCILLCQIRKIIYFYRQIGAHSFFTETGLNRESCENQEQYPLLLALYFFLNSILSHCFFENGKAFKKRASQKTCRFYT